MEKPAKTVNPYIFNLRMIVVTLLAFVGWNHIGWHFVMNQHLWIQWQTLPSPPSPIVELLPPWGKVQLRSEDGSIYSIWANGSSDEDWFMDDYIPPVDEAERLSSLCVLEDIPFSFSPTYPENSKKCYPYRLGPHSPASYVVRDEQDDLWVWVNQVDPNINIIYLCLIFLSGLVMAPLLGFRFMRWVCAG